MNQAARFAAATLPAATILAAVTLTHHPGTPSRPAAADPPPSATTPPPAVRHRRSALPAARRAVRWLLTAEAGHPGRLPSATFTASLGRELIARPPAPAPWGTRARLVGVHEQSPLGPVRRVLVTVDRAGQRTPVTLLLACRPACRVAAVQ
jgi:hypothetical protein